MCILFLWELCKVAPDIHVSLFIEMRLKMTPQGMLFCLKKMSYQLILHWNDR